MRAIITKYHAATRTRSARYVARDWAGNRAWVNDDGNSRAEWHQHQRAALALCEKMNWPGELIEAGFGGEYVYVFADGPRITSPATGKPKE